MASATTEQDTPLEEPLCRTSPLQERRIVVIGKTGSGKSSTCNNILGRIVFKSSPFGWSVTKTCQRATCDRFDRNIQLIDTPGLFDTDMTMLQVTQEIVKCIGMTAPGPHVFVLVLKIGRFTKEEQDTVEHIKDVFGEGMMKYLLILFTNKDDLKRNEVTFAEFAEHWEDPLKKLMEASDKRCITINNVGTDEERKSDVEDLMKAIDKIFLKNNGRCYTNDMFQKAEKAMKRREEELRKEHEAEETIQIEREVAKKMKVIEDTQAEEVVKLMVQLRVNKTDIDFQREKLEREREEMEKKLEEEKDKMKKIMKEERAKLMKEMKEEAAKRNLKDEADFREKARQEVNDDKGILSRLSDLIAPVLEMIVKAALKKIMGK